MSKIELEDTPLAPAPASVGRTAKVSAVTDYRPELVILCGIPGSGKTTRYRDDYAKTHLHLSLDKIDSGSRKKEWDIFSAAIARGDSIVVDNTNLTPKQRARYIPVARAAGYQIIGIELVVSVEDALKRNAGRDRKVPEAAIRARAKEFVCLQVEEGFDRLMSAKT